MREYDNTVVTWRKGSIPNIVLIFAARYGGKDHNENFFQINKSTCCFFGGCKADLCPWHWV